MPSITLKDTLPLCHTRTQAEVLRRLLRFYETSTHTYQGEKVTRPRLELIATQMGVSIATVSRAVKWLAAQGYILARNIWYRNARRLHIRALIALKKAPVQTPRKHPANTDANTYHCIDTTNTGDTPGSALALADPGPTACSPSPEEDDPLPPKPPSPRKSALSGKVGGIVPKDPNPDPTKSALQFCQWWNLQLKADGYGQFPLTSKSIAQAKMIWKRLNTMGDPVALTRHFLDVYESVREAKHKKAIPDPGMFLTLWVRWKVYRAAQAAGTTVEPAKPAMAPTPLETADAPVPASQEPLWDKKPWTFAYEAPPPAPEGRVVLQEAGLWVSVIPADPSAPPTVLRVRGVEMKDGLYYGCPIRSDGWPDMPKSHPQYTYLPIAAKFALSK